MVKKEIIERHHNKSFHDYILEYLQDKPFQMLSVEKGIALIIWSRRNEGKVQYIAEHWHCLNPWTTITKHQFQGNSHQQCEDWIDLVTLGVSNGTPN